MFDIRRPLVGALLLLCVTVSFAARGIAPPKLNAELMQSRQDSSHFTLAMWLSAEMFRSSVAATMKPGDAQRVVDALKGYQIYGVIDATIDGEKASIIAADRAQLRASARLQLGDRAPRAAVPVAELPSSVQAAVEVLKPMMASLLGKFGDSMEFIVFKDADEHGNSIADPRSDLVTTLSFDKESFTWRLPLVSLLPLRVDAATGDTFPGDYAFSPFTGNKLAVQK